MSCQEIEVIINNVDNDNDGFDIHVDCDDNNPGIYPGASEICDDGIDQDCDGTDLVCGPLDTDDDGDGFTENQGDCNDNNLYVFPTQTNYFTLPIYGSTSFDYNCSGSIEYQYPNLSKSTLYLTSGWVDIVPACGMSGTYETFSGTGSTLSTRIQGCK
jgi:hypothetical protein